jgi:hypothetical protein
MLLFESGLWFDNQTLTARRLLERFWIFVFTLAFALLVGSVLSMTAGLLSLSELKVLPPMLAGTTVVLSVARMISSDILLGMTRRGFGGLSRRLVLSFLMWGTIFPALGCVVVYLASKKSMGMGDLLALAAAALSAFFALLWSLYIAVFDDPEQVGVPVYSLRASYLRGASLVGANLRKAKLSWARLQGANLTDARLDGARLDHVVLAGAKLCRATLAGADLRGADLRGADVSGADLSTADLVGALLDGVVNDAATRWPVDGVGAPQGQRLSDG